jgi:hypothetical protein
MAALAFAVTGAPQPVAAGGVNTLKTPSFETTGSSWLSPWSFKLTAPAAGTVAQDSSVRSNGTYSARVNVSATSASAWHAQLRQTGIGLVSGRRYELSFWARAAAPRNVELVMQRGFSPYTAHVAKTFAVTTTWTKFAVSFTSTVSETNAQLSLNLAQSTTAIWIDDAAVWSNVSSKLGVSAHLMWGGMPNSRAQQTGWMQAGHMKWARFDVGWRWLEPSKGQFSQSLLTELDATLNDLQARGIRPVIVVVETPGWANGGRSPWYPPTNPADYANAIGFLAKRYANRPNMAWEIWNEPNLIETDSSGRKYSKYWMPLASPSAYTAMLKASYSAIKSADPDATVLGGSLVFYDHSFLDGMYAAGAKGYFDALAIHPYGFSLPPSDTTEYGFKGITERMKAKLDQHGDSGKKLWITEVGWWDRAVTGNLRHPTDATRGTYYQEVAKLVDGWSYVEMIGIHALSKSLEPDVGLVYEDGSATQSWTAYKTAADAAD